MYISRLRLENVGRYRFKDWSFPRGLIGVVGENGAGKSTLVSAMYACLTNDFTRLNTTKQGAICDLSDEEEDSCITLNVEHGGVEFELTRFLRPSKSLLKCKGQPPLRKAGDIQAKLEEVLGLKRQLIDNYVFVEQNHMFGPFAAAEAERAKAFQYLCNTVRAEEIWTEAGGLIGEMTETAHLDLDDNRDTLADQISTREQRIKKNNRSIKSLKASMLDPENKQKADQTVQNYVAAAAGRKKLPAAQELLERVEAAESASLRSLTRIRKLSKQADALVAELLPGAEQAKEDRKQRAAYDKYREEHNRWTKKANALEVPKKPKMPDEYSGERHDELAEKVAALHEAWSSALKVVEAFDDEGIVQCPTCGTAVDDLHDHLQELRTVLDTAPAEIKQLQPELRVYDQYCEDLQIYGQEHAIYVRRKKEIQEELDRLEAVEPPEDTEEEWEEAIGAWTQAKEAAAGLAKELIATDKSHAVNQQAAKAARERLEELENDIIRTKVSKKDYTKAQELLQAHDTASDEVKNLQASNEALQGILYDMQKELARKNRVIARAAKARKLIARLQAIREVAHRDFWPRIVAENYLEDIQDDMNAWLDGFGSPFNVRALDGLQFEFKEPGCPWRSAQVLSGGQKVVMALAFRRAINLLFASEIGMMALDEPTENLDTQNIEYLRAGLDGLAAASREAGNQIFIITHEDRLRPAFDAVIEISKD